MVNLTDKPLQAAAGGGCQGSNLDAQVRPERETKAQARHEIAEVASGGRNSPISSGT